MRLYGPYGKKKRIGVNEEYQAAVEISHLSKFGLEQRLVAEIPA